MNKPKKCLRVMQGRKKRDRRGGGLQAGSRREGNRNETLEREVQR